MAEGGMAEVYAVLARLKLEKYAAALHEHGYDDWAEILSMSRAKLNKLVRVCGMRENHQDRFRDFVAEQVAASGVGDYYESGESSEDPSEKDPSEKDPSERELPVLRSASLKRPAVGGSQGGDLRPKRSKR